jgi:hypothetical protein
MDAAGTIFSDSGHTRSKTGRFRAKRWNPDEGLGAAFCCAAFGDSGKSAAQNANGGERIPRSNVGNSEK